MISKPGLRCWVHCLSRTCNHRENVLKFELNRAKRYRCSRCGGPVEISKAAAENIAVANDARERIDARTGVVNVDYIAAIE